VIAPPPECFSPCPDRLTIQGPSGDLGYLIPGDGPAGWTWGQKPSEESAWAVNAALRQLGVVLGTDMAGLMLAEAV